MLPSHSSPTGRGAVQWLLPADRLRYQLISCGTHSQRYLRSPPAPSTSRRRSSRAGRASPTRLERHTRAAARHSRPRCIRRSSCSRSVDPPRPDAPRPAVCTKLIAAVVAAAGHGHELVLPRRRDRSLSPAFCHRSAPGTSRGPPDAVKSHRMAQESPDGGPVTGQQRVTGRLRWPVYTAIPVECPPGAVRGHSRISTDCPRPVRWGCPGPLAPASSEFSTVVAQSSQPTFDRPPRSPHARRERIANAAVHRLQKRRTLIEAAVHKPTRGLRTTDPATANDRGRRLPDTRTGRAGAVVDRRCWSLLQLSSGHGQ